MIRTFELWTVIRLEDSRLMLNGEAELLDGTKAPMKLVCFVEHILHQEADIPECRIKNVSIPILRR